MTIGPIRSSISNPLAKSTSPASGSVPTQPIADLNRSAFALPRDDPTDADHFHELLDQLAYVAQPMGVSKVDFECWLARATAAIEKARAIIEERRNPDHTSGPNTEAES